MKLGTLLSVRVRMPLCGDWVWITLGEKLCPRTVLALACPRTGSFTGRWLAESREVPAWVTGLARAELVDVIGFIEAITSLATSIGNRVRAITQALLSLPGAPS
jgi:hypothetical protein